MLVNPSIDFDAICAPLLCQLPGWQPLAIDGAILSWMRLHFTSGNIVYPSLQSKIWNEDYAQSQILIERTAQWRPQTTEQRPAVLLKRQELQSLHLGIGDRLMMGGINAQTQDNRSVLQVGAHTVFAVSEADGECELLANEVYQEILKFAAKFAERLNLVRMRANKLGVLSIVEESKQNFVVPIDVMYAWWDTWKLVPAGQLTLAGTKQSVSLNN